MNRSNFPTVTFFHRCIDIEFPFTRDTTTENFSVNYKKLWRVVYRLESLSRGSNYKSEERFLRRAHLRIFCYVYYKLQFYIEFFYISRYSFKWIEKHDIQIRCCIIQPDKTRCNFMSL